MPAAEFTKFLESHQYDALLLQKPSNLSWFTSGGDCSRSGSTETTAALFITSEARVLLCSNVDSGNLFDREVPGLGFQLKERPWHEAKSVLVEDLCRGRATASDTGIDQTIDVSVHLTGMRIPLTELESKRMRELGQLVAHCVEATARQCQLGQSEAEIAAELAHRMIKRQIIPNRIQVWADGRSERYRHWSYGTNPVTQSCVISAVGRRWGLCVGAARSVCFCESPE